VLAESIDAPGNCVGYAVPDRLRTTAVYATSGFVVGLLAVAVVDPYL